MPTRNAVPGPLDAGVGYVSRMSDSPEKRVLVDREGGAYVIALADPGGRP